MSSPLNATMWWLAPVLILLCNGAGLPHARAQSPAGPPREVAIVLILTDLSEVNGAEQSFTADVFMRASWHDPSLVDATAGIRTLDYDEVWHPSLFVYNTRTATESFPRELMVRPDGRVAYLQRYTGKFSTRLDLQEFPLDSQEFRVQLSAATRGGANVVLVADREFTAVRSDFLSVSDWIIGAGRVEAEPLFVADLGRS